jgi:hypothetical protein
MEGILLYLMTCTKLNLHQLGCAANTLNVTNVPQSVLVLHGRTGAQSALYRLYFTSAVVPL